MGCYNRLILNVRSERENFDADCMLWKSDVCYRAFFIGASAYFPGVTGSRIERIGPSTHLSIISDWKIQYEGMLQGLLDHLCPCLMLGHKPLLGFLISESGNVRYIVFHEVASELLGGAGGMRISITDHEGYMAILEEE